jgi:alpha-L-fucosidase
LLNVPPNNRGLLAEPDAQRLREFRAALDKIFAVNLAEGKSANTESARDDCPASSAVDGRKDTYWAPAGDATTGVLEIDLGEPVTFNVSMAQEYIALGQRIESYSLEAWDGQGWKTIAEGTTIGHKKLDRFPDTTAGKVRLTIQRAQASPLIRSFGLYNAPGL